MWPIKEPTDLPTDIRFREALRYPYLATSFRPLWLEALQVAHLLLDRHTAEHGNETYYQDNFGVDFIAALADPQFASSDFVLDEMTDPAMAHLHRNEQPAWQAFKEAQQGLKTAPRGAIALLKDGDRWHIRVHVGDAYVSDCKTMRSSGPKPTAREIHECVLSFEGYLARCQAREERTILNNFARLRDLNLQSGMTIRNVELHHNGKRAKIRFKIETIASNGYLKLSDGVLRGSSRRFEAWVPACQIAAEQVQAPERKTAVAPVDLETAALF